MEFTLPRSGRSPFTFQGDIIAQESTRSPRGRQRSRWHEVTLHRSLSGKYILAIGYRSEWNTELDRDEVHVMASPLEVESVLSTYDPVAYVVGYPLTPEYEDRQERLLKDIRMRWDALVSQCLDFPEFAQKV